MTTKPAKQLSSYQGAVLARTVAKIEMIWRGRGAELDKLLRVGQGLQALRNDTKLPGQNHKSLYGRGFIKKLSELTKARCGLELRKIYRCLQVADLALPKADWDAIKAAGLVWMDVRDIIRLFRNDVGPAKVREMLRAHLPLAKPGHEHGAAYAAWRKSKQRFQRWLNSKLNKHRPLPPEARFLVIDSATGRILSKRLRLRPDAMGLQDKAKLRGVRAIVVEVAL